MSCLCRIFCRSYCRSAFFNSLRYTVDRYGVGLFRIVVLCKVRAKRCVLCYLEGIRRFIGYFCFRYCIIPACEGVSGLCCCSYCNFCVGREPCIPSGYASAFLCVNVYCISLFRSICNIKLRYSYPAVVRFFRYKFDIPYFLFFKIECFLRSIVCKNLILCYQYPIAVLCFYVEISFCYLTAVCSGSRCKGELVDRICLS